MTLRTTGLELKRFSLEDAWARRTGHLIPHSVCFHVQVSPNLSVILSYGLQEREKK